MSFHRNNDIVGEDSGICFRGDPCIWQSNRSPGCANFAFLIVTAIDELSACETVARYADCKAPSRMPVDTYPDETSANRTPLSGQSYAFT